MESILSEQSATVDELVEACIQAFGWSFEHFFYILNRVNKTNFIIFLYFLTVIWNLEVLSLKLYSVVYIGDQAAT